MPRPTAAAAGLNSVYDEWGGGKAFRGLLHTKFTITFADKAQEDEPQAHYARGRDYRPMPKAGRRILISGASGRRNTSLERQLEILATVQGNLGMSGPVGSSSDPPRQVRRAEQSDPAWVAGGFPVVVHVRRCGADYDRVRPCAL